MPFTGACYAEEYVDNFKEFDDGSGTISATDMEKLIRRINMPLGVGKHASRVLVVHFIKSLNVPLTLDGRVPFRRTAFELVRRVSECDMPPGEMRDRIEYSIRKAFPDIWEPIPDELSWALLMVVIRVQRHWRALTASRAAAATKRKAMGRLSDSSKGGGQDFFTSQFYIRLDWSVLSRSPPVKNERKKKQVCTSVKSQLEN